MMYTKILIVNYDLHNIHLLHQLPAEWPFIYRIYFPVTSSTVLAITWTAVLADRTVHCSPECRVQRACCAFHLAVLTDRTLAAAQPYCHTVYWLIPVHSESWENYTESIYSWPIACHLACSLALYPPRTSRLALYPIQDPDTTLLTQTRTQNCRIRTSLNHSPIPVVTSADPLLTWARKALRFTDKLHTTANEEISNSGNSAALCRPFAGVVEIPHQTQLLCLRKLETKWPASTSVRCILEMDWK